MALSSEVKKDIFKKYGKSEADTGNSEAQIAMFSTRISALTEHLRTNKKDFSTQTALINLVSKRRRLLKYLQHIDITRYRKVIAALGLRK